MPTITIYTDGSALGNPGPGGYGAVLLSGQHRKELSQGFRLTTNNRMELMAVCVALEALKFDGSDVTVYSDSKYVVDAVTKGWVFGWVKKQFAGKKNPDLWMRFLRVYRRHNVRFVWVKGHADTVENNRYSRKYYSYYSSKYNFVLLFPSRWQGVVSAVLNTQDNEIVFISYDPEKKFTVDKTTELMRIRTIAKDDTEALVNSKDYRMIGESDESIICIKETTGYLTGKLALTESELQNSLIVL